MLAARGVGLGTVFTTLQSGITPELCELLAIPDDALPVALIPLGFPDANFGPTRRLPPEEVTFWDRWDQVRARQG
jgi:nitroreductase